jgi:gamma-glutamylcyclotransferase (GGCT)/AIG2-like uncharacterized protein YtfP
MISIFVYGTLKQGYCNHKRFCKNAISIEPAWVWGRLYHLPAGYPGIEVPEASILAHGTRNPLVDERVQNTSLLKSSAMNKPNGGWDKIHGELITFAEPELDLPPIDTLECFNSEGVSLYVRVLVAATIGGETKPVWLYRYNLHHNSNRIETGCWKNGK